MAAARDRTRSIAAAVRAHRHAAPIGLACGALIAGVMLLGNPFIANPPPAPHAKQPEIRLGAAELSLPEPAPAPAVPAAPKPAPAPARQASAPVFVVPPAPPRPVPATRQMGGGRRATIIIETLPSKPIIPPFVPGQTAGMTPEPHPALPLDTEIGKTSSTAPAAAPGPKTAAAGLARDG